MHRHHVGNRLLSVTQFTFLAIQDAAVSRMVSKCNKKGGFSPMRSSGVSVANPGTQSIATLW